MFNKKREIFYLFFLINLLFSLNISAQIRDLIEPVNLVSGKTDSLLISDIFYAENYSNFKFSGHLSIAAKLNYDNSKIILTPDDNFEGISLINFSFEDNDYVIPVRVNKDQKITFTFKPEKEYEDVFLFGSFNGWDRSSLKMDRKNGVFSIEIPLEPGRYQYKFFAEGEELVDPENPEQIPNGMGGYNSVITVEPKHKTESFLHIDDYKNSDKIIELSFIYKKGNKSSKISKNNFVTLIDNKNIPEKNISLSENKIIVRLNKEDLKGKKFIRAAVTENGQSTNIQNLILFDGKPAGSKDAPFTWYDAIIYSALIDRFNDGDKSLNNPVEHDSLFDKANYMGGDFQGIINKLNEGYFDSLGITALWISPVYDNTNNAFREFPKPHRWFSGYHGYWPIEARETEEKFGTIGKLKELVTTAQKHNVKVLLDIVAHHVHEQHPYFKEHPEWFGTLELPDGRLNLRIWDEHRLTTWFEPFMPSFNFVDSEEAVEVVADDAIWWLQETGADGFRQDAVKHIPNNFWQRLNRKLKEEVEIPENKVVFQMGETFGSYDLVKSYVNNGQLPAQFNFNLYDVAIPTFVNENSSFSLLDKELKKSLYIFGENNLMGNIMDSQDKDRFMAYADGDLNINDGNSIEIGWNNPPQVNDKNSYKKLQIYLSYLLSIPGVPIIYYGDEIGMTGAADPDNRRMMRFGDQLKEIEKENLTAVRKLIHLRNNHSALRYGDYYSLKADENIFAFIRSDLNERVLVVINKNPEEQNFTINLHDFYAAEQLIDLLNNENINVENNQARISIDGIGYRFFNLK